MSQPGSTAPIHSKKACLVYDPGSGKIHHRHSVVTFVGGQEPTADQIAADALNAMRALANAPSGELHVLHIDHDAIEPGKRYRVDPNLKTLVAQGSCTMTVTIREARADDAGECGRICYEAFTAIANAHGFPPDFPSAEIAKGMFGGMIGRPGVHVVVAERDGVIVGSNCLDERNAVSGVGPITVDPTVQDRGVGGLLMRAVMDRSATRGFAGIRLVQAGYHTRSLSLYSKLGFDVREPLSCMQGPAINAAIDGYAVRSATAADVEGCNALCASVHGFARGGELSDAVAQGVASVVERDGRLTGYTTQIAFFAHAVGETTDDLKALIAAGPGSPGPGFLVPSRNGALMRWCLAKGLRVIQPMTLMTMGLYNEPQGAWLPSILY